jgi:hypothetical protein
MGSSWPIWEEPGNRWMAPKYHLQVCRSYSGLEERMTRQSLAGKEEDHRHSNRGRYCMSAALKPSAQHWTMKQETLLSLDLVLRKNL